MLVRISGGKSTTVVFGSMPDESIDQVPIGKYPRITHSIRCLFQSIAWLNVASRSDQSSAKISGLLAGTEHLADHLNIRIPFDIFFLSLFRRETSIFSLSLSLTTWRRAGRLEVS